ncbi:N-acyl homoserine lactonase family protein [Desulfovibrio sp. OttesenSCG-928-O18]|nr:N-acyl homoserine lactonase family protein [Desulfovibrio sp. OttesenSCG-928-O18]
MTSRAIYALTVGKKPVVPINHLYMRPDAPSNMFTQFYYWCILDEKEGPILVDQSYTKQGLEEMQIDYQPAAHPLELLERLHVKPADVRHVILSHLHWDHYAGDDFFPNAHYYVHQKEIEYVTGPLMKYHTYAHHYNFKAIETLLHHMFSGRVTQIRAERETLFEGVDCVLIGGHTPGLMSVAVTVNGATKVICSDVVPRYQNVTDMTPCGIHYDVTEALEAIEKISSLAGSIDNILPGHDPALAERYEEVAPGVHRIV